METSTASTTNRAKRLPGAVENTAILIILADALVILGSLIASFIIRFRFLGEVGIMMPEMTLGQYTLFIALGIVGALLIFGHSRLYENQYLLSPRKSFPRISRSCVLWFVCYLAALRFLEPELARADTADLGSASRLYLLIAPCVLLVAMSLWRFVLCKLIWNLSKASGLMEQVIFLGWNQDCADAGQIMTDDPGSPMKILGAIRPPGQDFAQPLPPELCDFGSYEDLPEVLASGHVDMLITSDTELKREDLSLTITLCEKEMVGFQLVPTCFRVLLGGLNLEKIFGMPLLGISRLPLHSRVNLFIIKRVIDFIGGLVGIVVGAPLIALFGAIIYLESPGPIFYRQRRVGQRGREFDIIKLRSMKIDSEADTGAVWAVENDPRRLKIGKFLRASNIDEIPQFWNVMKGEMSLVGPRPERPELIKKFRDEIPHYNARHSIKPGITGWAQVNGLRGNTDLTERIKYDLHYIERWNILFDFQIMFLTFLKRENAY